MQDPKRSPSSSSSSSENPNTSRRGALIRLLEIGAGIAGAAVLTSGTGEPVAEARRALAPIAPRPQATLVSLQVETPGGDSFPSFRQGSIVWVAGAEGQRYNLRLQNHSPERLEVVVTVDGRDVISGQLGDYVKHRGYVLGAFESLVIEGYRQSLDQVAAFRFADLAASYSARLGTPVHFGAIGVAAFTEARSAARRPQQPLAPKQGDPFPGSASASGSAGGAPPVVDEARRRRSAPSSKSRAESSGARDSWAAPEQPRQLGTEYGESSFSPVQEVAFKRKNRRKPDALFVRPYDSIAGLRARGVVVDEPPPRLPVRSWDRQPSRSPSQFAPPPPPKDW